MGQTDITGSWLMIVYANGSSIGVVSDGKVYSEIIAEKLNARLINKCRSGVCNDRIIRTALRDLLELRDQTDEKIVALINISDLWRSEIWTEENKFPEDNDGHFSSFHICALDNDLFNTNLDQHPTYKEFMKFWFLTADYEGLISNLYYKLILLTNMLKTKNIEYIFWAASRNFKEIQYKIDNNAPFMKCFSNLINQDKNILPLDKFNFCDYLIEQGFKPIDYDKYGDDGHHGEPAHRAFAEYLLTKI